MQNNGEEVPDQAISQEEGLKQFVHWLFEIYSTLHTSYLILVAHECRDFQQILLEKNLLKCGAKFDRSNIFCGCSILFGFDRILDVTFADSLDVMRKIVEKGNMKKILQVTLIRKGNKFVVNDLCRH